MAQGMKTDNPTQLAAMTQFYTDMRTPHRQGAPHIVVNQINGRLGISSRGRRRSQPR